VVELTLASGDHGVDLLATNAGETVIVQCKRNWATTVGEAILRDLYGALHHLGAQRAILVTTGRFPQGALGWAGGKPVEAWDGHELVRRWAAEIA
jgi:HJR/Mrr/RecB family endonuclease